MGYRSVQEVKVRVSCLRIIRRRWTPTIVSSVNRRAGVPAYVRLETHTQSPSGGVGGARSATMRKQECLLFTSESPVRGTGVNVSVTPLSVLKSDLSNRGSVIGYGP